jgi:hypothetical protein
MDPLGRYRGPEKTLWLRERRRPLKSQAQQTPSWASSLVEGSLLRRLVLIHSPETKNCFG